MRRAVERFLEDPLAEELLRGNVKPGDRVDVVAADGKLSFQVPAAHRESSAPAAWPRASPRRESAAIYSVSQCDDGVSHEDDNHSRIFTTTPVNGSERPPNSVRSMSANAVKPSPTSYLKARHLELTLFCTPKAQPAVSQNNAPSSKRTDSTQIISEDRDRPIE